MLEILGQAGIAEVILVFVLLFVIPMTAYLLLRLRRYENEFGVLTISKRKKKKKKKEEPPPAAPADAKPSVPSDVFPYRAKTFINPSEHACLAALAEAVGGDIIVYVKVALWALVESTEKEPGYFDRLTGKWVDFLVADAATGKPFTAVCFEPGKGVPRGPVDDLKKICQAAGLHLVFIPQTEEYDVKQLKNLLDIPDLDM